MKTIALLTIALGLSGCATEFHSGALVFPDTDCSTYRAPDGRVWVRYHAFVDEDGTVVLAFTPNPAKSGEWVEQLIFSWNNPHLGLRAVQAELSSIKARDDPEGSFTLVGDDSAYLEIFHFPRFKESGISKVVRSKHGYTEIAYEQRLGETGKSKFKRWRRFIQSLPNRALLGVPGTPSHLPSTAEPGARRP